MNLVSMQGQAAVSVLERITQIFDDAVDAVEVGTPEDREESSREFNEFFELAIRVMPLELKVAILGTMMEMIGDQIEEDNEQPGTESVPSQ